MQLKGKLIIQHYLLCYVICGSVFLIYTHPSAEDTNKPRNKASQTELQNDGQRTGGHDQVLSCG